MTVRDAASIGLSTPLFAAVESVNHRQRELFVEHVARVVGDLDGRRIALLGLTFKPDTDDLREAPALYIAARLIELGAHVVAYDPMPRARVLAAEAVPGLDVVDTAMAALVGADVVGLVTEWPEFRSLPWAAIARIVRRAVLIDGRNALQPDVLAAAGFTYVGFGRRGDDLHADSIHADPGEAVGSAYAEDRGRVTIGMETNTSGA